MGSISKQRANTFSVWGMSPRRSTRACLRNDDLLCVLLRLSKLSLPSPTPSPACPPLLPHGLVVFVFVFVAGWGRWW